MTAPAAQRTAIVTGASRGLGLALTTALVQQGWHVVVDGRDHHALAAAHASHPASVTTVPGDVTDPTHRAELIRAAGEPISLVVNNAGGLGPSPLPALADVDLDALTALFVTNVVAPLGLIQEALPYLTADAVIVDITSDAAVEAYEGWGAYGATKAALEHLGAVLAVEQPGRRILTIDPGDMRTKMHQEAFPGEDISDRPTPDAIVPAILTLIAGDHPSGRYRATAVLTEVGS